jgi:hypothetical protein
MKLLDIVKRSVWTKHASAAVLSLAALLGTTADADAATIHLYGRYYICDIEFLNTTTMVSLYADYSCSGSYVGSFYLAGPNSNKRHMYGATRFEALSRWLSENRYTPLYFAYDEGDKSLFYMGARGG